MSARIGQNMTSQGFQTLVEGNGQALNSHGLSSPGGMILKQLKYVGAAFNLGLERCASTALSVLSMNSKSFQALFKKHYTIPRWTSLDFGILNVFSQQPYRCYL